MKLSDVGETCTDDFDLAEDGTFRVCDLTRDLVCDGATRTCIVISRVGSGESQRCEGGACAPAETPVCE